MFLARVSGVANCQKKQAPNQHIILLYSTTSSISICKDSIESLLTEYYICIIYNIKREMKVANSILASVAVLAVVDAEGLRVSF